MVMRKSRTPSNPRLNYPFVTLSLYTRSFLGLNMHEPHKPLLDSGLAVFLFSDSNKTAPKVNGNGPIARAVSK